jgi:putative spermidine/putrescine transport system permease protein
MVSYYVAYFTNVTINWGMACALSSLLLLATLVLYGVYRRFAQLETNIG